MKKYIGMFIIAGLCGSATAAVVTNATITSTLGSAGSSTDLFQNATVTSNTGMNVQFPLFDIRDLFTAGNPFGNGGIQEDVVFADTNGTTTSFADFNTPVAISIESIDVVLQSDDLAGEVPFDRALNNIKVYASDPSGTVASNLVANIAVDPDYVTAYGSKGITVTIDFSTVVTAQYFRVEFEEFGPRACRIFEVDAYAPPYVFDGTATFAAEAGVGDSSDDFQYATVTDNSDLHGALPTQLIEDLFTATDPIDSDGSLIIVDGLSTSFIDFEISGGISLTNMVLVLENDGAVPNRAVNDVKVFAGTSPEAVKYNQVAGVTVDPDYITAYGGQRITLSIDFATTVTSQYFRVELGHVGTSGPRIMEIDGYGTPYFDGTTTFTALPGIGDPWDQFKDATITSNTPLHVASAPANDIADLFNAGFGASDDNMFFEDGASSSFVDFNISGAIIMTNMVVTLLNEGVTAGRAVDSIKVYASTMTGDVLDHQVANITVDPDYISAYGSDWISVGLEFNTPVTGQYFRVELGYPAFSGCRIYEIDGYGASYLGDPVFAPSIISLSSFSSNVLEMVVNAPSSADHYSPESRADLVFGSWGAVAHSIDGSAPFIVTNLSYSSTDATGTNEVIYVEADSTTAEFFQIIGN